MQAIKLLLQNISKVLIRILTNVGRVVAHDAANITLVEGEYARVVRAVRHDDLDLTGTALICAWLATAAGLAVAIPAVIFYNYFSNKLDLVDGQVSNFSTDFLNLVERDLLSRV